MSDIEKVSEDIEAVALTLELALDEERQTTTDQALEIAQLRLAVRELQRALQMRRCTCACSYEHPCEVCRKQHQVQATVKQEVGS